MLLAHNPFMVRNNIFTLVLPMPQNMHFKCTHNAKTYSQTHSGYSNNDKDLSSISFKCCLMGTFSFTFTLQTSARLTVTPDHWKGLALHVPGKLLKYKLIWSVAFKPCSDKRGTNIHIALHRTTNSTAKDTPFLAEREYVFIMDRHWLRTFCFCFSLRPFFTSLTISLGKKRSAFPPPLVICVPLKSV